MKYIHIALWMLLFFVPSRLFCQYTNVPFFSLDFQDTSQVKMNVPGQFGSFGPNKWTVNAEYTGGNGYPNTTDQLSTVSGTIWNPGGAYLHISDDNSTVKNANFSRSNASDRFCVIEEICAAKFSNVEVSFFWMGEGDTNAFAEMYYSTNGGNWTQMGLLKFNNQSLWKKESFSVPALDNKCDIKLGFRWVNSTSSGANTISFGLDDLKVSGDFDSLNTYLTPEIYASPDSVCRGQMVRIELGIRDTLCASQYRIRLYDSTFVSSFQDWVFVMNLYTFSKTIWIRVPTNLPPRRCYYFLLERMAPLPRLVGQVSSCMFVDTCLPPITTLDPPVCLDSNGVCKGSVIDVPFWSYGGYLPNNEYIIELSDSSGDFSNPISIGSLTSAQPFSPIIAGNIGNPGRVRGVISDNIPPGCNYMLRIGSTHPVREMTPWGPFCIKDCHIEVIPHSDQGFCIGQTFGDTSMLVYNVTGTFLPGNQFKWEILDFNTFGRVNLGGLGQIISQNSDSIAINVPSEPILVSAPFNLNAGNYYARLLGTNPGANVDSIGRVIRLTIGAPKETGPDYLISPDTLCRGNPVTFSVLNPNPGSTYFLDLAGNEYQFNTTTNSLTLNFSQGHPTGIKPVQIWEDSYGCITTITDSLYVTGNPIGAVNGPPVSCSGGTETYFSPFMPVTTYQWSLSPSAAGVGSSQGNRFVVTWDTSFVGTATISLDTIYNQCGANSGFRTVSVRAPLFALPFSYTDFGLSFIFMGNSLGGSQWLWDFGDGNTSTQENPYHTYAAPGSYYVCQTVIMDNGCTDSFCDTVIVHPVGITKPDGPKLDIYPNPATHSFWVDWERSGGHGIVSLYNFEGAKVATLGSFSSKIKIDVLALPPGIYLLEARGGSSFHYRKIMIR